MDLVGGQTVPYLAANACPFSRGKDMDDLLKFVMDALEQTLFTNNTSIVRVEAKQCHSTDILKSMGWTKFDFIKVFSVDP